MERSDIYRASFGLPISDDQIKEMALALFDEEGPKMNQGELDRDEIVELRKKLLALITMAEDVLRAYDLNRENFDGDVIPGSSKPLVDTFEGLRRELRDLKGNR